MKYGNSKAVTMTKISKEAAVPDEKYQNLLHQSSSSANYQERS
jgi:hypothetical protein